ncbi:MAG: tetratricopeptide repeat protein [Caldilineaceae bacterium]|nr:tetratricopeptide repeat protein [Caldilineaceae bacterium]
MALTAHPDEARFHYHRGLTLMRLGRFDEAAKAFDSTAKGEPDRQGLRFLQQLTRLAAGRQEVSTDDLSAGEKGQLALLKGVQRGAGEDELASLVEKSMLPPEVQHVWQLLVQMHANSTSAPVTRLPAAVGEAETTINSTVLAYYVGVAAMRKGDEEAARTAWRQASRGLSSPWFLENRAGLLRQAAVALAQEERWQEVLDLSEADLLTDYEDSVLNETVGLANFHLGYTAAEAGLWLPALKHLRAANRHVSDRRLAQDLALAEEANDHWVNAAEAWREMARRRPRKSDHPDYLTDEQVAAIWSHASDCYGHVDEMGEAITCLKNAIKYAPDDLDLRMKLVDVYRYDDRNEAAINELDRILESHPDHVPALMRLAALLDENWYRDPEPIWKRVLRIEPENVEARDALAEIYIERASSHAPNNFLSRLTRRPEKDRIKELLAALEVIPDHPRLFAELGMAYVSTKKMKDARAYLRKAFDAAGRDVGVVGLVLHELLHADGGDDVKELVPQARQFPGLLASFWIEQGDQVLHCELGDEWAKLFWDEALELGHKRRGDDTKAYTLLRIYEVCNTHGEDALAELYEARIREEEPRSGGVEYVDAFHASQSDDSAARNKALRLIRKAQRVAQKAQEPGIEEMADRVEALFSGRMDRVFGLLDRFGPAGLLDILNDMDDEDLDELKHLF